MIGESGSGVDAGESKSFGGGTGVTLVDGFGVVELEASPMVKDKDARSRSSSLDLGLEWSGLVTSFGLAGR